MGREEYQQVLKEDWRGSGRPNDSATSHKARILERRRRRLILSRLHCQLAEAEVEVSVIVLAEDQCEAEALRVKISTSFTAVSIIVQAVQSKSRPSSSIHYHLSRLVTLVLVNDSSLYP